MKSTPLVSIITPVYNGAAYLDDLIMSVRDQDYLSIEHIIIDDGSNDNGATIAILKKYPHLRWWTRENKGQYATMNEGLEAARGDIVCFISADDLLTRGAVKTAIEYLMQRPELDGLYGRMLMIDVDRNPYREQIPCQGLPFKFYPYLAHVSHCSLYIRMQQLIKNGELRFNPNYHYCGDYDWMIRLVINGLNVGFIDTTLSLVRMHNDQATQKHRVEMSKEHDAILREYHFDNLQYRFLFVLYYFSYIWNRIKFTYRSRGIREVIKLAVDWLSRKIVKQH